MGICVIFACSLIMVGCHEDITEEQSEIEISSNDNVENAVSEYQEEQLEPEILNFRDVFGEEYQVEVTGGISDDITFGIQNADTSEDEIATINQEGQIETKKAGTVIVKAVSEE